MRHVETISYQCVSEWHISSWTIQNKYAWCVNKIVTFVATRSHQSWFCYASYIVDFVKLKGYILIGNLKFCPIFLVHFLNLRKHLYILYTSYHIYAYIMSVKCGRVEFPLLSATEWAAWNQLHRTSVVKNMDAILDFLLRKKIKLPKIVRH